LAYLHLNGATKLGKKLGGYVSASKAIVGSYDDFGWVSDSTKKLDANGKGNATALRGEETFDTFFA